MNKDWNVQVVFDKSDKAFIQIQMTSRVARLFVHGHKNITQCVKDDVTKAVDFLEEKITDLILREAENNE